MSTPQTFGPYETERDTYTSPLAAALASRECGCTNSAEHRVIVRDLQAEHLRAACDATGVELGAYDERILTWLAGYEAQTVQVVIGLIRRAHAAGQRAGIESTKPDFSRPMCGTPSRRVADAGEPGRGVPGRRLHRRMRCPDNAVNRRHDPQLSPIKAALTVLVGAR